LVSASAPVRVYGLTLCADLVNMQAQRPPILHGVPREGRGPFLAPGFSSRWPQVGPASPPKRKPIITLHLGTYRWESRHTNPGIALAFALNLETLNPSPTSSPTLPPAQNVPRRLIPPHHPQRSCCQRPQFIFSRVNLHRSNPAHPPLDPCGQPFAVCHPAVSTIASTRPCSAQAIAPISFAIWYTIARNTSPAC